MTDTDTAHEEQKMSERHMGQSFNTLEDAAAYSFETWITADGGNCRAEVAEALELTNSDLIAEMAIDGWEWPCSTDLDLADDVIDAYRGCFERDTLTDEVVESDLPF
jgi:hypothetical protein